jgi:hypothetical protein
MSNGRSRCPGGARRLSSHATRATPNAATAKEVQDATTAIGATGVKCPSESVAEVVSCGRSARGALAHDESEREQRDDRVAAQ